MLIGELAQKTGLSSPTIRFYEKKGLIAKRYIRRGTNNYRHYSREAVKRITAVKIMHAAGFTLAEIKNLLDSWDTGKFTPRDGVHLLQQKMDEIDARIADLKRIKVEYLDKMKAHIQTDKAGHSPKKKI